MRVQIYWVRDNRGNELFLRDGHAFVAQLVEDSPGSCGIGVDFCEMTSCSTNLIRHEECFTSEKPSGSRLARRGCTRRGSHLARKRSKHKRGATFDIRCVDAGIRTTIAHCMMQSPSKLAYDCRSASISLQASLF